MVVPMRFTGGVMSDEFVINGLPLPSLLISLIQEGRWKYPGRTVMRTAIPDDLVGPIDLPIKFYSLENIRSETSRHLRDFEDDLITDIFHLLKGSTSGSKLPWLDIEKCLFIAGSEVIGDDIEIALDYRTNPTDPRVVISDWRDGCWWAEVTATFTEFVARLDL
jgi:hypothetical protein